MFFEVMPVGIGPIVLDTHVLQPGYAVPYVAVYAWLSGVIEIAALAFVEGKSVANCFLKIAPTLKGTCSLRQMRFLNVPDTMHEHF